MLLPLACNPGTQLGVLAVALGNIAVPVGFAILGKFAQTVFPGGTGIVPFETYGFQRLNTAVRHIRSIFFYLQQPILRPLVCDPCSQFGVLAIGLRNIARSVDFAIFGKFAETILPARE